MITEISNSNLAMMSLFNVCGCVWEQIQYTIDELDMLTMKTILNGKFLQEILSIQARTLTDNANLKELRQCKH